jgi:hypothetical protein
LELVLEAAIELATCSKNREHLSQIVATLKNNAKIALSESKEPDPSEAINAPLFVAQGSTSRQTALSVPAEAVTPPSSQVWKVYSDSMATNWSNPPPRNAKVNAQAKKLVDLVGLDNALILASYYPTRRKPFYIRKGHDFGMLLTDYHSLLLEIRTNTKLTDSLVKKISEREDSEESEKRSKFEPLDPFDLSPPEELETTIPKLLR